jgi:hypothetical protein
MDEETRFKRISGQSFMAGGVAAIEEVEKMLAKAVILLHRDPNMSEIRFILSDFRKKIQSI